MILRKQAKDKKFRKKKTILICKKCGRPDDSFTAYCLNCGRTPHELVEVDEDDNPK